MKPSTPAQTTEPPVVAESTDSETQAAYDQLASRRKGLLSTILSRRNNQAAGESTGRTSPTAGSQTTLG